MSKLLLVEDDNNLREIYEARLQAEGYTIVTAKDGEEALVVAKAERPDLIISDIMMPKISGFEMLDILRNTDNLKNVPVIMLTALGQNDDQQRADKLGADRYLVKSQVTLEDIVRVTHELLGDIATTTDTSAAPENQPATATPVPSSNAPATTAATPAPVTPVPPQPTSQPISPPVAAPEPDVAAPVTPAPPTEPVTPAPTTPSTTSIPVSEAPAPTPEIATEAEAQPESTPVPDLVSPSNTEAEVAKAAEDSARTSEQAEAKTTAQEGAEVDARIEDFVTGATQDASPPTKSDVADSVETDASPATPNESTSDDSASTDSPTVDEELIEKAVENIETNTLPEAKTEAPEIISPTESAPENTEDKALTTNSEISSTSPVVHDKVIKPLEADPKKDINTLLALEAVKEASGKPTETAKPVIVSVDQTPVETTPLPSSQATALGANPTPSMVIKPVAVNDSDSTSDTQAPIPPAITPTESALAQPIATDEPETDLNGIAL